MPISTKTQKKKTQKSGLCARKNDGSTRVCARSGSL